MGITTFSGPIRTGKDSGNPDTLSIGHVTMNQVATVSAAMTSADRVAVIPTPSRVTNIYLDVDTAFATTASAAGQHRLKVGISGDTTRFAEIDVSAVGRYTLSTGVSGNAISKWRIPASADGGGGTAKIVALVSSPVTALDTGSGELIVEYRQESPRGI